MGQNRISYTTEDEKEYIKGLGTHSEWAKNYEITHIYLVRKYIENAPLRSRWDKKVAPKEVMDFARGELSG